MNSSSEITYCLIFDTNALFQAYEKKADFTTFSFNATFEHDELLITYKNTISKKRFPKYSIYENPEINYSEYIKTKIEEFKKEISEGLNEVIEIPIASNNRFESIVNRAFSKLPPFEGKDKKSDKGFKDAKNHILF